MRATTGWKGAYFTDFVIWQVKRRAVVDTVRLPQEQPPHLVFFSSSFFLCRCPVETMVKPHFLARDQEPALLTPMPDYAVVCLYVCGP